MQEKIIGSVMPVLELMLDQGERIVAEAGELSWIGSSIDLHTSTNLAGAKGIFATVFAELEATPEAVSPLAKLGATNWKKAAKVDVDEALLQYLDDEAKLKNLTNALDHAEPVSSKRLPIGF